jgi:hypothetical protein
MGKIENERQYEISKKRVEGIKSHINNIRNTPDENPIRKQLHLACLIVSHEETEKEIIFYESLHQQR